MTPTYAHIDVTTSHTSTTLTTLITGPVEAIFLEFEPDLTHPIFSENPDRLDGAEAAMRYLMNKRADISFLLAGRDAYKCSQKPLKTDPFCKQMIQPYKRSP